MRSPAIIALLCASLSGVATGQGSLADYERAARLREVTRDKVFRDRLAPRWVGGGPAFFYRVGAGPSRHEYVLVDPDAGTRGPAFDHAELARTLSTLTGETVDPDGLPLERLSCDAGRTWTFRAFSRSWRLTRGVLVEQEADGVPSTALAVADAPGRSSRGGADTEIIFRNRTSATVTVYWLDVDGRRRPYGEIAPGSDRPQSTYAGHVWIVVGEGGRDLAAYVGVDHPLLAKVPDAPVESSGSQRTPSPTREGTSPDGRHRAFVRDHDVVLVDVDSGEEFALTTDGVAEDGYQAPLVWSPDGRWLAVRRVVRADRRIVHFVEAAPDDQLQPKLHELKYFKPGDVIDHPRPVLFDVDARVAVPIEDELFSQPWSIGDLAFDKNSRRLTFLYNQRGHQVLRVIAVDVATGRARALIDETSATFVDYAHKTFRRDLDATREILWMSERDGWNHLYLIDADDGDVIRQVTSGEWVVRRVESVDEEAREVWFMAGGVVPDQDPYHLHLCRASLDGGDVDVLTEGDGTHRVEFSPDRRYFIDEWSRVDHPPVFELRRSSDGALVMELERADWSALLETGWRPPQRFVAKGRDGETDIHGIVFRPMGHDPTRRYPVVEQIYAGPHGAHVPKRFGLHLRQRAIAELGFVVVQIDGMGTSHRSKAFHDVAWKNLGDSGFPDRIAWIEAVAAEDPSLDLTRVGIFGGSAGGQSAMRALIAHGDFYHVAVADCGCHDNRIDKIWWNELWMGWPIGPHYAEQSNVDQAHRMNGKLLLIVGEVDRNVDPASTMQVVKALIDADKDFDLLVMPGVGHGAAGTPYGRRRLMDFLVRHLHGREPRWQP